LLIVLKPYYKITIQEPEQKYQVYFVSDLSYTVIHAFFQGQVNKPVIHVSKVIS